MSITKEQIIDDFKKESELYAESGNRLKNGALDEHYIAAYEENPIAKKVELLRTAIKSAGLDIEATRQRAYEIHNRLSATLEKRLLARAKNARALGLGTLEELCQSADSESVRATVALALTKDIFPDVQINKEESMEDLDRKLEQNQRELEALTGITEH